MAPNFFDMFDPPPQRTVAGLVAQGVGAQPRQAQPQAAPQGQGGGNFFDQFDAAPARAPGGDQRKDADIRATPEYLADKAHESDFHGTHYAKGALGDVERFMNHALGNADNGVSSTDFLSPLPIMDEVQGGLAAAGAGAANLWGKATGGKSDRDMRAAYLAGKDQYTETHDAYAKDHPIWTAIAPVLGGLGKPSPASVASLAGAAPKSAAPLAKAARFAKGVAKGSAAGGVYAAAYGASNADGGIDARAKAAADSVLPGMAAGGLTAGAVQTLAPLAAKAGSAGRSILNEIGNLITTDPSAPPVLTDKARGLAEDLFSDTMSRGGISAPGDVDAAVAGRPGPNLTAAELAGREGLGNVAALSRRSGATGDAAASLYQARRVNTPADLLADVQGTLKIDPTTAAAGQDAATLGGRAAASPKFDAALRPNAEPSPRVWNADLAKLSERPAIRDAIRTAHASALNAGRDPATIGLAINPDTGGFIVDPKTGQPQLDLQPTAETWDTIRKTVGASVERDPVTNRVIATGPKGFLNSDRATAGRDLTAALRDAIPGYGDALDTSGDYLGQQAAFDRAKGSLTRGTVGDFGKAWASAGSESERNAIRASMANDALNLFNSGQLRGGKFSVPGVQQKLELAFGRNGAQEFIARAENRARALADASRMAPQGNSITAEANAYMQSQDKAAGQGGLSDLAEGGVRALQRGSFRAAWEMTSNGLLKAMAAAKTAGMPVPVRDELGRLYLMDADQIKTFLSQRAASGAARPAAGAMRNLPPHAIGAIAAQSSAQ